MKRATSIKILLIEDDPSIVKRIEESLRKSKRKDLSLIHAHTMHEAFRVLAKKRIDLILVDTVLPDGRGAENFDALQSVSENIPFIVLCRNEDHEQVKEALSHGAQDCVSTESSSISRILPRAIFYALDRSESARKQKLVSREVALSEKKYRDVVENAVEIIYTTDANGNFIFANRRALAETGFTLQELCTRNYLDLVLPEFRRRLATHYIRQYSRRIPTTYVEFPHRIRTGEIKWWAQNATLMMDDDKFTGFLVVARDITDRKKTEEALEDSEKRYRELFLSNPHPMWVYDLESLSFLEVNDAAVQHYGYSKSEFLAMRITDIRPEEDIPALMENVQRVDEGIDVAGIWRHRKKSGDIIDVEITSHTLLFRGRQAELVLSNDVTEQRKAQRKIQSSEEKHRNIVDWAPVGIYQSDRDGRFLMANISLVKILGYDSIDELMQKNIARDIYYDTKERDTLIAKYEPKGHVSHLELRWKKKDGSPIWIQITAHAVKDSTGKTKYFEGFVADITEQKNAQQELQATNEKLAVTVDSLPIAIYSTVSAGTQVNYISQSFKQLTGYKVGDILSAKSFWKDRLHPDDSERVLRMMSTVFDVGKIHLEYRWKILDGSYRWFSDNQHLIRNPDGSPSHIVGTFEDITERRTAEERLKESEEKFRALSESNQIIIARVNDSFELTYCNPATSAAIGQSTDHLIGHSIREISPGNPIVEEWLSRIDEVMKSKRAINYEYEYGGRFFDALLAPEFDLDHNVRNVIISSFDISELKRTESALRENEAKYRQLFEAESDALLLVDNEDGRIIEANAAALTMYGFTREEIVTLRNSDISAEPEETKRVTQKSPININEIISIPLRYHRKKDGTVFPVEITGRFFNHYGRGVHIAAVRDISERVAAEESRKQSQERYQSFVSQSSEGIWRFELEIPIAVTAPIDEQIEHYFLHGYLAECNDAMAKMYGYERSSDIIGARLGDLLKREDQNNITFLRNFITSGYKLWDGESCEYDKANNQKYFRNSLTGIIQDGKLVRAWGMQQDITEQKRVNDALRESESRYRTLIETSRDGISLTDMAGIILYANKQKASMLGYERSEQLVGESAMRLLVPNKHDDIAAVMNHLNVHEYITNVEFTVQRKDGSTFPAEFSASIIKDDQGSPIAIMDVMRDITERKFAEQALRQSEEQYRVLIEQSPDPIYIVQDDIVVLFNSAWLNLFGYTAEELRSEKFPIMKTVAPESLAYIDERRRLRRAGEIVDQVFEFIGVTKSGTRINLEANIIDIVWKGKPARQGIFRDITKHKQIQNELRVALVDAQKADRLKDAFIANISHEIRTPINIILGYSNIIKDVFTERATEPEKKFFDSVGRASKRLLRTVDEILNIASLQTNSYLAHPERFNVHASLEKLAREMQLISSEKNLPINFNSECPGLMVYLDIYSFEQALTNLLDNAIKYTQSGSIDLILKNSKHTFSVLVRDTGIGISEDYLPHLFDQFSQEVIGYTRPYEGIGLGMALTKKYTEMNHGKIEVSSRKGEGTTFTLTFAIDERLQSGGVDDSNIIFVTKSPNLKLQTARGRILVVEDDRQNQEFMELLLAKYFDLSIVESAEEAWQILHSNRIDLILMDIALRGDENGIQFTRRIRATEQFVKIPIIAVTAFAFPDDRENSLQAGCNEYLSKPFTKKQFYSVLHNFILFDE